MTTEVLLDIIEPTASDQARPRFRLVARSYPSDARGYIALTSECAAVDQLEQEVVRLQKHLDTLLEEARATWRQQETQERLDPGKLQTVEEIWQALEESGSLEAMRELFNSLAREKRREVASYVFSRLNIFKGAASIFSQHYNEEEAILQ